MSSSSACSCGFLDAIDKDGAILPKGILGDQIRKVVEVMDGPISKVLQLHPTSSVELELWRVHAEHISKVRNDGGKPRGCQADHPVLMNWAIACLARTSASTYNEAAKITMLPNISTVYRKKAELITTKNDKAYCTHMNTICSISDHAHRTFNAAKFSLVGNNSAGANMFGRNKKILACKL